MCKKQTAVSESSAESEIMSLDANCGIVFLEHFFAFLCQGNPDAPEWQA